MKGGASFDPSPLASHWLNLYYHGNVINDKGNAALTVDDVGQAALENQLFDSAFVRNMSLNMPYIQQVTGKLARVLKFKIGAIEFLKSNSFHCGALATQPASQVYTFNELFTQAKVFYTFNEIVEKLASDLPLATEDPVISSYGAVIESFQYCQSSINTMISNAPGKLPLLYSNITDDMSIKQAFAATKGKPSMYDLLLEYRYFNTFVEMDADDYVIRDSKGDIVKRIVPEINDNIINIEAEPDIESISFSLDSQMKIDAGLLLYFIFGNAMSLAMVFSQWAAYKDTLTNGQGDVIGRIIPFIQAHKDISVRVLDDIVDLSSIDFNNFSGFAASELKLIKFCRSVNFAHKYAPKLNINVDEALTTRMFWDEINDAESDNFNPQLCADLVKPI